MPPSAQPTHHRWASPIPYTLSPYLCIELVNSRFTNYTGTGEIYDRLELPRWRTWFTNRAAVGVTEPPTPKAMRLLRQLRRTLRDLLENQTQPDPRTIAWINHYLAAAPTIHRLQPTATGMRLQTVQQPDWPAVIAATLSSYGQLLQAGTQERVRCCANPHCTWLFYDESRNATRRWCDAKACGNLCNVQTHRQRVKEQETACRQHGGPDPPARG